MATQKALVAITLCGSLFWPLTSLASLVVPDRQFDLICDLHGHVVSDPHPVFHGNYPANVKSWHEKIRFAVDLDAMSFCDPVTCARRGPERIRLVSARAIVLDDKPNVKWSIHRGDWRSMERLVDMGRVSLITGNCRKASFSGLSWHLENGRPVQGN